jgi:hypothetical protein
MKNPHHVRKHVIRELKCLPSLYLGHQPNQIMTLLRKYQEVEVFHCIDS